LRQIFYILEYFHRRFSIVVAPPTNKVQNVYCVASTSGPLTDGENSVQIDA